YNGTLKVTGAAGDGVGSGIINTAIIVASQMADNTSGNFAAKACANYSYKVNGVTYGGWYLPSQYEWLLIYKNISIINNQLIANGGTALGIGIHWTSTEYSLDSNQAYVIFDSGATGIFTKDNTFYVRAVRAF
ncbi:MAG: hypothetical protein P8X47_07435, partial [Ignavibacteriaceae bacterium]